MLHLNYVFCRAKQDANKNRLYVHEVFVSDKIKKGDTLQTAASKPHGGISLYRDILANVLETVAKTEPQQSTNAVSDDSLRSTKTIDGINSEEPNGKSTVSDGKDKTKSANSQENQQKTDEKVEEPQNEEVQGGVQGEFQNNEPQPIGEGDFGPIYNPFKGNAKGAVVQLSKIRNGEATAALHHKDIGDIDIVWGNEGTGHSDGFGLAKLLKYHPEVVDKLQEIIDEMSVVSRSENRINLESEKYKAGVRLTWNEKKKTWLLTLFEKKNSASDNTTDTGETVNNGKLNDTATQQNTVSDGKDTTKSPNSQENQQKTDEKVEEPQNEEVQGSTQGVGQIGEESSQWNTLSEEDAKMLIQNMEDSSEDYVETELSPESWNNSFDEDNSIETPIGRVKMGGNQISKFLQKKRTKEFGMVAPTLSNPDVIVEEKSEAKDGNSERQSSYILIKTFNRNGEKIKFYASITVKKDGMEVSISSHYMNRNAVEKRLMEDNAIYIKD